MVTNRREYPDELVKRENPTGYLGFGTELTWHSAPDCQCDVEVLNLDRVEEGDLSDTESTGAKTLVEAKAGRLCPRHLNQIICNAVTY